MNLKSRNQNFTLAMAFCISAVVMSGSPAYSTEKPLKNLKPDSEEPKEKPAKKNKLKNKASASRNNHAVKIYPDILKRDMHVVAKENNGKLIEFFVFDLEGTLVQNYKMKAKDHIVLTGLARGEYQYRVFCGDEETTSGNFEIR